MAAYQQYLYTSPYILVFVNKCNKKVIVIFFMIMLAEICIVQI